MMKKLLFSAVIAAYFLLLSIPTYASDPKLVYLLNAYAYPVPFRPNFDASHRKITFAGLPSPSIIRIYTITGELAAKIEETDNDGINNSWDACSAASGMYIYIIEYGPERKKGQLLIIR